MGNGKGKFRKVQPGQEVAQGQILGQGGMEAREMQVREDLNLDLMLVPPLQQGVTLAAAIVKRFTITEEDTTFEDSPDRERQLAEAMQLHADFVEMDLRLLATIRSKMKKCSPFSKMKDLKFIDDAKEV